MRHFRKTLLFLLCLAGLLWLWARGDRKAQELGEWKRVWGDVCRQVLPAEDLPPDGASVETFGRAVLKEWETTRRGGAEVRGSVEELETALWAATEKAAAAEKSLADLRARMEEEEAAAVAELRERYLSGLESSRAEVAQAREERAEAVRKLAAAQTQMADLQGTLEALMNAPGQTMALAEESGAEPGEPETPEISETPAPGTNAAPAETPLAAVLAEAAPDLSPEEIASLTAPEGDNGDAEPEESAAAEPVAEEAVVASRVIGESRLFLTLAYRESDGLLRAQFRNGGELAYSGVPREVADSLRDAGSKLDSRMRSLVKGKYPADADEDAAWQACAKWNRHRKGRMEALWTEEE